MPRLPCEAITWRGPWASPHFPELDTGPREGTFMGQMNTSGPGRGCVWTQSCGQPTGLCSTWASASSPETWAVCACLLLWPGSWVCW